MQAVLETSERILLEKINNKTATIGVVGLGYVGLPLAVEKAKAGYNVVGFDVVASRVAQVNAGENYIGDVKDEDLFNLVQEGKFFATTQFSIISDVDAIIICVPTPLDKHMQPDITYVKSAANEIGKYISKGSLVVLESTTYPGTTEEIFVPIFEKEGYVIGEDVFIAYSPERVDPGKKDFKTKNTPKVVGGITPACTNVAATLYRNVIEGGVYEVSSPAVAEMEKVFENIFRNINIALSNEMALICNKMGIDVWEVIDAAKTKPYGFMAFYPGPGLGGHCIPIDPFYLTWKAREFKYHTKLIETAGEINNAMPEYIVNRSSEILNEDGLSLRGSKIAILGVAYKKDIEDVRESPVLEIIEFLQHAGAEVAVIDPYVESFKLLNGEVMETVPLAYEMLENFDLSILTTDHTDFHYPSIGIHAKAIFDTRNAFKGVEVEGKYYKL